MKNKNLQLFKVQTHIHGSGGHGIGSHLGYDFIASQEGIIDVVIYATEEQEIQLEAEVSGTEEGDMLMWLLNGYLFSCSEIEPGNFRKQITLPFQSDENLKAVRIQIVRPKLVDSFCGGIIAFTNPVYVISKEIKTAHRTINMADRVKS